MKGFLQAFHPIFSMIKANTYLVLRNSALCDEFISYNSFSFGMFVLVPQSLSLQKTNLVFSVLFLHRIHFSLEDDGKLNHISFHEA